MERELFDWSSFDGDLECMTFYNPVLKVPVGHIPARTKFDHAIIEQFDRKGTLQFWIGEEMIAEFKLHYRVGERIV